MQFFTENEYFKYVGDIIQKQIIFTNFAYNVYKFVTLPPSQGLHVPGSTIPKQETKSKE